MSDQIQNTAAAPVNSIFGETETIDAVLEHNTAASSDEHEMAATSARGESTGQEKMQLDTVDSNVSGSYVALNLMLISL